MTLGGNIYCSFIIQWKLIVGLKRKSVGKVNPYYKKQQLKSQGRDEPSC